MLAPNQGTRRRGARNGRDTFRCRGKRARWYRPRFFSNKKAKSRRPAHFCGDRMLSTHRRKIFELTTKSRLPAIYSTKEYTDDGGLMSYGANFPDLYRRAATYVDKILKGLKPG